MKTKIKKIIKEYSKNISEQGGYDDEDIMRHHYSGLMNSMVLSGSKIYSEYKKLVEEILPEMIDEENKDGLITILEELKKFLSKYDEFLFEIHNKNLKKFNK